MGSALSNEPEHETQPEETTKPVISIENFAQIKNQYYHLPETPFDDYPIMSGPETKNLVFKIPKIKLQSLFSESEFEAVANQICEQLREEGFFILELNPPKENEAANESDVFAKLSASITEVVKPFFDLPTEEKERISRPGEEAGKRNAFSGYSEIHFLNNDSLREEEKRDVFQVRLGEKHIPWPNSDFQSSVCDFYRFQWNLSLRILSAISHGLKVPVSSFVDLIAPIKRDKKDSTNDETDTETVTKTNKQRDISEVFDKPEVSQNTNLCLFRYHDVVGYKETQKCMVHVDNGFVTILSNWSTRGSLHVLSHKYQHFIPLDLFLDPKQYMIVYCGNSMQFVTSGAIPGQVHRVIREPQAVRYSFPFEMKPNDKAVLRRFLPRDQRHPKAFQTELTVTDQAEEYVFEDLMRQISWQKVRQKVARADSLGSDTPWYQDFYSTDMN